MITTKLYGFLDRAMEYFNANLFEGTLPDCILTLNRKTGTYGYHHHDKFKQREGEERRTEISLNPDGFAGRTVEEVLSTLVHEMFHAQQYVLDIAPRKGYHDKQFSKMMFDGGLQTSSTGEFGGKPVGQKMSHYIIEGGKFEVVCQAFLLKETEGGFDWDSVVEEKEAKEKKKTRFKFTCPVCMVNVMGKKDLNVVCGDDMEKMIIEDEG